MIDTLKTICDKCWNYEVHPSGVIDNCHAIRFDNIEHYYFQQRVEGEKNHCKCYKPIKRYATN